MCCLGELSRTSLRTTDRSHVSAAVRGGVGRLDVDALAAVLSRLRLSVLWWTTSGACAAHVSGQEWQRALLVLTTHAPDPGYHGSARARGIPLDARTGRLVGR